MSEGASDTPSTARERQRERDRDRERQRHRERSCNVSRWEGGETAEGASHTPSIAFQHLPPNSARYGYTTKGALFISAQLSTDAVSALRNVWVSLWKQHSAQAPT